MYHSPRVLIVEDEPLIALMLEDLLRELGCHVVGCAHSEREAFALLGASSPQVAIIDVHLGSTPSFAVASACEERDIPVVYATGYSPSDMASFRRGRPLLSKPYSREDLALALREVDVLVA